VGHLMGAAAVGGPKLRLSAFAIPVHVNDRIGDR
jgi:hypothetical protein